MAENMERNGNRNQNNNYIVNENGMSLAARWKSGLLSVLFSRFAVIMVMLLLQILILLMILGNFGDMMTKIATWSSPLFALIMLILLINSDMDSSGKVTWILVIAVMPAFGTLLYIWTKLEPGHHKLSGRIEAATNEARGKLNQDEEVFRRLKKVSRDSASVSRYTMNAGNFPVYGNTKVTYFSLGEEKLPMMLKALESAEKFIFLEYFIIQEGYMWGKILEILDRKVREGVEVRVMFDGTCLMSKLPADYDQRLRDIGIKCRVWAPLKPVITSTYNYRDHRKILVVDGRVAFNGGVNLADEYINRTHPFGHWKDTAVMIEGDAITSYTMMFLTMWGAAGQDGEEDEDYMPYYPEQISVPSDAAGFVLPYGDSPLDNFRVGEMVYIDVLNTAEEYVYIMSPYLILDDSLETALKFAAERGVDVRLILPGIPDKKAVYALAKATCYPLIRSGVKVYFYTPGFVHAKVFVSDDQKAIVGTVNLDYRSLYHHFECATYMVETPCIGQIRDDFLATQEKCTPVTEKLLKSGKLIERMTGAVIKMVAPML